MASLLLFDYTTKVPPSHYVHHWALFVTAMHLLLGVSISATDINFADELLSEFYALVPELYPEEMLTANLHSIIHLCSYVRLLGPLWTCSTFGFESMNGHITKQHHGNRNFYQVYLMQYVCNILYQNMKIILWHLKTAEL